MVKYQSLYKILADSLVHSNNAAICWVDVNNILGSVNAERDAATTPETQEKQDNSNDKGHHARLVLQLGLNLLCCDENSKLVIHRTTTKYNMLNII